MTEIVEAPKNSKIIRIALIIVFILIFGSVIFFLFSNLHTPTQYQGGKLGGKAAPTIKFKSMVDNETYSLQDLKGKIVFVNFFNTWCVPCNEEEPVLKEFIEENKDDPDFVFISIAREDSKDNIKAYISEDDPIQDVVFDEGEISLAFGVTGQPETFAVNKEGIVSATLLSRASKASLDKMLAASR